MPHGIGGTSGKTASQRKRDAARVAPGIAARAASQKKSTPTIRLKKQGETVTAKEADRRSEERRKTARREVVKPTIDIGGPKKTGLAALREKPGVAGTVAKVLTSPKTTVALGATLATLLTFGGAGGLAAVGTRGATTFARVGSAVKAGQAASNAKTAQLTTSMISKVIAGAKAHPVVATTLITGTVGSVIGSYPWAEWAQGEAREVMGFAINQALRADVDAETIQQLREEQDAIWDQNLWESIARLLPGTNIAVGFMNKYKALRAQMVVNDKIMADRINQIETGETEDEKWERVREEEAEQDTAAID